MLSCARKLFHINSCLSTNQQPLCLNRFPKLSLLSMVKKKKKKGRICQFTIYCQVDAKVRPGELIHKHKCATCQPLLVVFPAVFNW